ncbi:TPA: hypothetical protein DEP26_04735 [Candidatus Uhrbacteria bacterium]|nr:hypothetical protein [Candidatus Uhrbacteria bacterium]
MGIFTRDWLQDKGRENKQIRDIYIGMLDSSRTQHLLKKNFRCLKAQTICSLNNASPITFEAINRWFVIDDN